MTDVLVCGYRSIEAARSDFEALVARVEATREPAHHEDEKALHEAASHAAAVQAIHA